MRRAGGERANRAAVETQLALVAAAGLEQQCGPALQASQARADLVRPALATVAGRLLNSVVTTFQATELEAVQEAELVSLVLQILRDVYGVIESDEEVMNLLIKIAQKEMKGPSDGRPHNGRPTGRPSGRPSGRPNGRPTGRPSGRPNWESTTSSPWSGWESTTTEWSDWSATTQNWSGGSGDYPEYPDASGDLDYHGGSGDYPGDEPSIEKLEQMDVDEIITAFQVMNAGSMQELLMENPESINEIISKFSPEQQLEILEAVAAPHRPGRPGVTSGILNKTTTELMDKFAKMGAENFQRFVGQLDEASQWDLLVKMNGTEFGEVLEDVVYDYDYNQEENAWGDVFSESSAWRRKRSTREKQTRFVRNSARESSGGPGREAQEGLAGMAQMGLQGFLMMDQVNQGARLPRFLAEIPSCLKQILWETETADNGFICSKLPSSLKSNLRKLMLKVLKRQIPESLFKVDWERVGEKIENSGVPERVAKIVMGKLMTPLEAADVREVLVPIRSFWSGLVRNETNVETKRILEVVEALLAALDTEIVHGLVADIAREVQGESRTAMPTISQFSQYKTIC